MTREEAKELYPIVKAFAEGKVIEYRTKPSAVSKSLQDLNRWLETKCLSFESDLEYRIKPESKYRPFLNADECCKEMRKHQPFGWVISTNTKMSRMIDVFDSSEDDNERPIFINESWWKLAQVFEKFTFADGTPFGIKVEE